MNPLKKLILTTAVICLSAAAFAGAPKAIHFARGADSAVLKDRVIGYQDVRYTLTAKAGQIFSGAVLKGNVYANIYAPGDQPGKAEALFSIGELHDTAVLPQDGTYLIQVYQMRNAARNNKKTPFTLKISVRDDAAHAAAPALQPAPAAAPVKARRIQFAKGRSSGTVRGTVHGYDGVRYVLRAKAGQTLTPAVRGNVYLNVYAPGTTPETAEAIYNSSSDGLHAVNLPEDGDYLLLVYQMRSAAREHSKVPFTLNLSVR